MVGPSAVPIAAKIMMVPIAFPRWLVGMYAVIMAGAIAAIIAPSSMMPKRSSFLRRSFKTFAESPATQRCIAPGRVMPCSIKPSFATPRWMPSGMQRKPMGRDKPGGSAVSSATAAMPTTARSKR